MASRQERPRWLRLAWLRETPARFVHEVWTVRDGLPVNSITRLLQTRDGYRWLATFDGLVRFDGVQFTVYSTRTHARLSQ